MDVTTLTWQRVLLLVRAAKARLVDILIGAVYLAVVIWWFWALARFIEGQPW